ncbi:hypothetical protein MTR67_051152 [Solanum verrucosum]|uniref:Integrase catalytic domain-containing protein n=1 Tax=Solanum verrucosum TaxID=315347 RepID=A0AAF0ZYV7_SOLVR|nr:hypothetical protein MTR67_051152 [Solanum verrucosum]
MGDNVELEVLQVLIDPLVEQVSHVEFQAVFQVLAQDMTTQVGREVVSLMNPIVGMVAIKVRNFTMMNPSKFYGSKVEEDLQQFVEEIYKIVKIMEVTPMEKANLDAYQLKKLKWAFLDRFFPFEMREAKVLEYINLGQENMSVKEYVLKFTQLSKYAPIIVADSRARIIYLWSKDEHVEHLRIMLAVIAYVSRQLNMNEKNYLTHDLKLAAMVFALKIWRYYLYDVYVDVLTDSKSLKYTFTQKDLNLRQMRWFEFLKNYDMSVLYHPDCGVIVQNRLESSLVSDVKAKQDIDLILVELKKLVSEKSIEAFSKGEDGILCYQEMVRLHGVPLSIIFDHGTQFISQIWKSFQKGLGTQMKLRTTFHPRTDGQAECTIHTLEDILKACVIDFKGN